MTSCPLPVLETAEALLIETARGVVWKRKQQRTCSSSRHCFHMHRGYWPAHCPPNRSVLPLNSTRTPRSCHDSSRTVALRALIPAQSEACIGKPTFAFTTLLLVYQASYNTPTVVPDSILQHTTVDSICRCCFLLCVTLTGALGPCHSSKTRVLPQTGRRLASFAAPSMVNSGVMFESLSTCHTHTRLPLISW
jgi:hypothetical protein